VPCRVGLAHTTCLMVKVIRCIANLVEMEMAMAEIKGCGT
jgi:hypothetical protein